MGLVVLSTMRPMGFQGSRVWHPGRFYKPFTGCFIVYTHREWQIDCREGGHFGICLRVWNYWPCEKSAISVRGLLNCWWGSACMGMEIRLWYAVVDDLPFDFRKDIQTRHKEFGKTIRWIPPYKSLRGMIHGVILPCSERLRRSSKLIRRRARCKPQAQLPRRHRWQLPVASHVT